AATAAGVTACPSAVRITTAPPIAASLGQGRGSPRALSLCSGCIQRLPRVEVQLDAKIPPGYRDLLLQFRWYATRHDRRHGRGENRWSRHERNRVARKATSAVGQVEVQSFVHRLAQFLTSWEATTFLIGEYA